MTPGIAALRRQQLAWLCDVAQAHFEALPTARSLLFACGQCWNDEAVDAVQDVIWCSSELIPQGQTAALNNHVVDEVDFHRRWQPNLDAVWAFGAMCSEEGWTDDTGTVSEEPGFYLQRDCSLLLVQRLGDQLRASWLGSPMRGWLDFHDANRDRDYRSGQDFMPALEPDPAPPELVGRERELHDEVLAHPYDRGIRDVLRDLWLERGDPRGEFCTVAEDEAQRERAAALVAEHGRSWLGALQPVIPLSGALFGYGPFVRKAYVFADREKLDQVREAREWGSIEELIFAPRSARAIVPAMRNVRAIGPLAITELAPLDGWSVEALDVELAPDWVSSLCSIALPLRTLRLRPARTMDDSWLSRISQLASMPWWETLERLEIWLPSRSAIYPGEMVRAFDHAIIHSPTQATLTVGTLDADARTGWLLAGDRNARRLEIKQPDARVDQGLVLSLETGLPLESPMIEGDDWLALGLGVPSIRQLPAPAL